MKKITFCVLMSAFLIFNMPAYAGNNDSDLCIKLVGGALSAQSEPPKATMDYGAVLDVSGISNAIISTRSPETNLSPSHWGHPGYENLAFLYDKAVDALVLKAAGYQQEAEDILDYIIERFNTPLRQVVEGSDTNSIYGILKLVKSGDSVFKSPINSIDINSKRPQGAGILEFWTTPGPVSFLIFSLLHVDKYKYKDAAVSLGKILASMQRNDGGVPDGDRAPDKIHTEPHMDAFGAFLMLYELTGDEIWKSRADKAYKWFEKHVYHPEKGTIDQGLWAGEPNDIFAEDVYAWTMAGPAGDRMSAESLKHLTDTMLKKSLSKITVVLPDGTVRTVMLVDFSDPGNPRVMAARGGFHPMGSVEWTGGAILALQKNAVRSWEQGDAGLAKYYKAMAECLINQTAQCFYKVDGINGTITFYATGQGYEVAPFGSVRSGFSEGWVTPSFLAKVSDGEEVIKGGSSVGAWPLLPYLGMNPFVLGDKYKKAYDKIPVTKKNIQAAFDFLNKISDKHKMNEVLCKRAPRPPTQIIEPAVFIREMWRAMVNAERGRPCAGGKNCYEEAIEWAGKVVSDLNWVQLARRDNSVKKSEFHGLIYYKWGQAYEGNLHPAQQAIARYPILNEMGCAMWALATANFELGRFDEAKYWMGRIIDEVPLHQIAATAEDFDAKGERTIIGYWNAIVSWETNPDNNPRTARVAALYKEVLAQKGITTALPETVDPMGGREEPIAKDVSSDGAETKSK